MYYNSGKEKVKMIGLSVVIPVHNSECTIEKCLKSVLGLSLLLW